MGTSGVGSTALTATSGGAAAFTYTFPNGTATGTVYQFQSSGVGTITGATGFHNDGTMAIYTRVLVDEIDNAGAILRRITN